jgi:hypothetical protein
MRVRGLFGAIVVLVVMILIGVNGVWRGAIAQAPIMPPPAPPTASPSAAPSVSPNVSPSAAPTVDPNVPLTGSPIEPIPGSRTEPPMPTPSSITPSPTPLPTPSLMPSLIIPNNAEKLPIEGEHKDPLNRFRVGLLKGYRVTPLGDSVLMESPDGRLAYTVVAQTAGQLGLSNSVTIENLAQIARNALQRGEGFQAEPPQSIVNGLQMNWTGQLTIGGKTQPVNGIILAKPGNNSVLLLTIAATEAGAADLPGAIAALGDSLQGL